MATKRAPAKVMPKKADPMHENIGTPHPMNPWILAFYSISLPIFSFLAANTAWTKSLAQKGPKFHTFVI